MARQALGSGFGGRKRGLDSIISPTAKSRNKGKTGDKNVSKAADDAGAEKTTASKSAAKAKTTAAKTTKTAESAPKTAASKSITKAKTTTAKTTKNVESAPKAAASKSATKTKTTTGKTTKNAESAPKAAVSKSTTKAKTTAAKTAKNAGTTATTAASKSTTETKMTAAKTAKTVESTPEATASKSTAKAKTTTAAKRTTAKAGEPAKKHVTQKVDKVAEATMAAHEAETVSLEENVTADGHVDAAQSQGGEVLLPIIDIEPNREQPRKVFDEAALQELAESIRQYGVLSPILVQKNGDYYEIIAGERRWRAAKMAGLKEVPVIIREYTRQEVVEISLIENIQREDLNPIEEARAYKRLLTEFDLTQDAVAARVSKSRAAITNSTRLLKLDPRVQDMLVEGSLTAGHARTLLSVADADEQYALAARIVKQRLSVREVEKLVKDWPNKARKRTGGTSSADPLAFLYNDMENRLTEALGTKVAIRRGSGKKGKIEISYHSDEELERLTAQLFSPRG